MRFFALGLGLAIGAAASNPTIFDDTTFTSVKNALATECGEENKDACLKQFDTVMNFADRQNGHVTVADFVSAVQKNTEQLQKSVENQMGVVSFLNSKANVDLSVPCTGTGSCLLAEKAMNACNYGRVLTTVNYQTVNINAHILGVVSSMLCGCVYVANSGVCLLSGKLYPVCETADKLRQNMFQASVSSWEAVKGMTRKCNIHGDPKAAIMFG